MFTFELLPGDEVFFSFYSQNNLSRKLFLGTYKPQEAWFRFGSIENYFGMVGFLYQFQVSNIIYISSEEIKLPSCVFSLEDKCEKILEFKGDFYIGSIESCCFAESKEIRMTTNYCYLAYSDKCGLYNQIKPDFIYYYSNTFINWQSDKYLGVKFLMSSNNPNSILGSDNEHRLVGRKNLTGHNQKGQYFDGNQYFTISPVVNFFSSFSIIIWFKVDSLSFFLFDNPANTRSSIFSDLRTIVFSLFVTHPLTYLNSGWNYYRLDFYSMVDEIFRESITITHYINNIMAKDSQNLQSPLIPSTRQTYLGYSYYNTVFMKGWIYEFI